MRPHPKSALYLFLALGLSLSLAACRSPEPAGDISPFLDSAPPFDGTDEDYAAGARCPDGSASALNNAFSPAMGGEEAVDIVVTVSSDFRCPYCAIFGDLMKTLWAARPDLRSRVRVYFHHFPIESLHPDSPQLHLIAAATARQSQDAFWELHDTLFEWKNQSFEYNLQDVLSLVDSLGIDRAQLDADLEDDQLDAFVKWDLEQSSAAGVQGTPWIMVCGQYLADWGSLEYVLDDLL